MGNFVSDKIRKKSESRLAFVQAVYMLEFGEKNVAEVLQDFVNGNIGRFVIEEKDGEEEMLPVSPMDAEYFSALLTGLNEKRDDVVASIKRFLKDGWDFEHLDGTLRSLLLCAAYELIYTEDVDAKVLIQEYVDLAYAFFTKNEPKMVNAILDQMAKEVR